MNILIAEDDPTSALVLRRSLEKLKHDVTVAEDGLEAWSLLNAASTGDVRHRVLISDWMMPRLDGLELLERIRGRADAAVQSRPSAAGDKLALFTPDYLYIIMLTAKGAPEDRLRALEAGADDFLVKPLDQAALAERLEVAQRILALQEDAGQTKSLRLRVRQEGGGNNGRFLGDILLAQGALTHEQLRLALDLQARTGQVLGPVLLANKWVTEEDITRARAVQVDVPYVAVLQETPDPNLLQRVSHEFAETYRLLPLGCGTGLAGEKVVRVALANPWDIEGLDQVQRLTGLRPQPFLASEGGLAAAIARAYRDIEGKRQSALLEESLDQAGDVVSIEERRDEWEDMDASGGLAEGEDDAPVIRLVNAVIADAVRRRASDIHIEPYKRDYEIRYRVDGELQVVRTLSRQSLPMLTSRLKVMAELDISERRVPQDGRISLNVDGIGVDLRVSTLPTQFGERIVLRVLDRSTARLTLDQLGFAPSNLHVFDQLIRRPHGIILVTGPTGSGKTTTLYAALNALRSPTTNILTCEDPIEYELDRIGQSAVNTKAGLNFAAQLRAILRQDPDIVLVGEIRDAETAETAFRAAMTGHLVLSTLHCNEAAGAPTRLVDMGVAPFLIASALIGVVAQRLVKRLCPECRAPYPPSPDQRRLLKAMGSAAFDVDMLYKPVGCAVCDDRGTRGRLAVHEILTVNDEIERLIMDQAETRLLRDAGRASGMVSLLADGLDKAGQGLTTLEDVIRKLGAEG